MLTSTKYGLLSIAYLFDFIEISIKIEPKRNKRKLGRLIFANIYKLHRPYTNKTV